MTAALSTVSSRADDEGEDSLVAHDTTWWLGWLAVGLLAAEGPILLAACCHPAGLTGLGTFWFVNDFAQYEAAMRQGAAGPSWLIFDQFTPETHAPVLMFAAYVALGKLSAALGLDALGLYRPAELLARLAFLLGVRQFVRAFVADVPTRRLAAMLVVFGMGLGLPVAILGGIAGFSPYTGNGSYEVNSFGLLFSAPHAALAMAITLWLVVAVKRSVERDGRVTLEWSLAPREPSRLRAAAIAEPAIAAAAGLALALLHPFHLPALFAAMGIAALLVWRARGVWGGLVLVLTASFGAAPLLVYDALVFARDPFWTATYSVQNVLPTPTPPQMLVEYGVLLLLAVPGAAAAWRGGLAGRLVLLWVGCLLVASYFPLPYQRRLGFGLQPALALLAIWGLGLLQARLGASWRKPLHLTTMVLAFSTTAVVMIGIVQSALRQQPLKPYRADVDTAAAARFVAAQACPEDVVLSDWDTMNYLAGQIIGRVVGGHPVATVDTTARKQRLSRADEDVALWPDLVNQFEPTLVLYGGRQRGFPPPSPRATKVFEQGAAIVYRTGSPRCD